MAESDRESSKESKKMHGFFIRHHLTHIVSLLLRPSAPCSHPGRRQNRMFTSSCLPLPARGCARLLVIDIPSRVWYNTRRKSCFACLWAAPRTLARPCAPLWLRKNVRASTHFCFMVLYRKKAVSGTYCADAFLGTAAPQTVGAKRCRRQFCFACDCICASVLTGYFHRLFRFLHHFIRKAYV